MLFERQVVTAKFLSTFLWPMIVRHYKEVSANQDIPLEPNLDQYEMLENSGKLRCYVAKQTTSDNTHAIVGYQMFILHRSIKYVSSLEAHQDLLFMDKNLRGEGLGEKFIDWCDGELRSEGVQLVYQREKVRLPFGKTLAKLGYRHVENTWSRRLDKN